MVWWLVRGPFTIVAWVQFVTWELRSHINLLHPEAKKKKYKGCDKQCQILLIELLYDEF